MSIESDYEPKYVKSLDDVPLSGPDDYSPEDKRKALFSAETELELDVNGGDQIPAEQVTDSHRLAAINYATHDLTHAAADSSSPTLGDMSSGGTATQYASKYMETYNNLVDKILSTDEGSDSRNFSVSVNNGTVPKGSTTHTSK